MANYEDMDALVENVIIGAVEAAKTLGDLGEGAIDRFKEMMENHKDKIKEDLSAAVDRGAMPGELSLELRNGELTDLDIAGGEVSFSIKEDENKYYGYINMYKDDYESKLYANSLSKEANELSEGVFDILGDDSLAMATLNEVDKYKADKAPDKEILEKEGYSEQEAEEFEKDVEKFNEEIKRGDIRALKAERNKLIAEKNKAYMELRKLTPDKEEYNKLYDRIKGINDELDANNDFTKVAKEQLRENNRTKRKEIIGLAKAKANMCLHNIANSTVAVKTTTMFINRGLDIKSAYNHLENSINTIKKKNLAIEHSMKVAEVKKLLESRNKMAIKMAKKNNRKEYLKGIISGYKITENKEFTDKQTDKLAKITAEIESKQAECATIENELSKIDDVQKEHIEKVQHSRELYGRDRLKSLDDIVINNKAYSDKVRDEYEDKVKKDEQHNMTMEEASKEYSKITGRNIDKDIENAVKRAEKANSERKKETKSIDKKKDSPGRERQ